MNHSPLILKNGIKILMLPQPTSQLVTVGFFVQVGSRHETIDQYGICHLLEHMMFKETTKRLNGTVYQNLDLLGATYNATTSTNHIYFYIHGLAENIIIFLDIILDIYLHLKVSDRHLQIEKKVVLEEMKMRDDQPFVHLYSKMHHRYFRNTTLAHDVIGNHRCLIELKAADLIHFKNMHFKPAVSVFVIEGDFVADKVIKHISPILSAIVHKSVQFKLPNEKQIIYHNFKNQNQPSVYIKNVTSVNQCYMLMSFPLYQWYTTHRLEIDLLINVLSYGLSSTLYTALRETKGLIYTLKMQPIVHTDCALFVVQSVFSDQSLDEVLAIIFNQFSNIKKHKISINQWTAASNALRSKKILYSIDRFISSGLTVLNQSVHSTGVHLFNQWNNNYKTARSKIRKIARQIFKQHQLNLFLYGNVTFNNTLFYF